MQQLPDRVQGPIESGFMWQDELLFGQCDAFLNVRISTLLENLVTASSQHCRHFGMTYESFLASDSAFVLIRTTVTIEKLPYAYQLLTLRTWIDGIKGPYYQRVTQWLNEEGEVVVSGRSDWVIIRPSDRSFVKPDKSDERFTQKSPVNLPPCQRVKWGDLTLEPLGEHRVVWSEIDANGHLHSANYGDLICDVLPPSFRRKIPTSFTMEFQKECGVDDVIILTGAQSSSHEFFVVGECEGQTSFKGVVHFAEGTSNGGI